MPENPYERYDLVDAIIAYETDEDFSEEDEKQLLQYLVNDGTIYSLQGKYQRRAKELGLI